MFYVAQFIKIYLVTYSIYSGHVPHLTRAHLQTESFLV